MVRESDFSTEQSRSQLNICDKVRQKRLELFSGSYKKGANISVQLNVKETTNKKLSSFEP